MTYRNVECWGKFADSRRIEYTAIVLGPDRGGCYVAVSRTDVTVMTKRFVLPKPRGVKAGALAACDENVGFLPSPAGVNDGESTFNVFLELNNSSVMMPCAPIIVLVHQHV